MALLKTTPLPDSKDEKHHEIYCHYSHLTRYFEMPSPLHYFEHLNRSYANKQSNNTTESSEASQTERTGFIITGASLVVFIALMPCIIAIIAKLRCASTRRGERVEDGTKLLKRLQSEAHTRLFSSVAAISAPPTTPTPTDTRQANPSPAFEAPVCTVCLDVMDSASQVYCLPCRHIYHRQCLEKWVAGNHQRCPLCRKSVFSLSGR
ncbi:hypothetical protein PG989_000088 [Apiospora arundinis]